VAAGIAASFAILARTKPALLFAKGGYVSVPPVLAAALLRIPVWIHESDADPGLATRIAVRYARRIFVSYEETIHFFPEAYRDRISVSGNPVRSEIAAGDASEGRRIAGCRGTSLCFGAGRFPGASRSTPDAGNGAEASGPVHDRASDGRGRRSTSPDRVSGVHDCEFLTSELPHLLAAADLVISRAGAGTVWENAVCGKPAILVPLGTDSSRGDQIRTAGIFQERGAAVALVGEDANAETLLRTVTALLSDSGRRREMGEAARKIALGSAARFIAGEIERELGVGPGCPA
jgi:UDP-N-acetylglucosamine--N-acetylmuramyl-(pentapeptide) pyrophosphoryl-undecaprenol N-acetylglucosamine transferase